MQVFELFYVGSLNRKYLNKNLNAFYEKSNDSYQNIEIYKDSNELDRGILAFLHGG